MASEITCPVCNLEHILPEKTSCPQCDADLTCFQVLDSLPDEAVFKRTGSRIQVILIATAGLFLCLSGLLIVSRSSRIKELESRISNQQTYPMGIKISPEAGVKLRSRGGGASPKVDLPRSEAAKEKTLETLPSEEYSTEGLEFLTYEASEKDTLWVIAKRYYGVGEYYPVLLEHNSHLGIYDIGDGVRVRILKNADLANEIYKKIIKREGNRIYWFYRVVQEDTLQSIARRYYKTKDGVRRVIDLNPTMELKPGEAIKIALE